MKFTSRSKRGCRYWFNLLAVGLVSFLILGYTAYIGLWVYGLSQPAQRPLCCITPADLGLDYEEVTLPTADGLDLAGWYISSRNRGAVILLHGYGANRMEMLGRAEMLANHGYGVLLYDERASGESQGKLRSFGWADAADLLPALDFLRARDDADPERIGVLGFSAGAMIALQATEQMDGVRAVVAEEPGFAAIRDLPKFEDLGERWSVFNYRLTFLGLTLRTGEKEPAGIVAGLGRIPPRPLFLIASGPPEESGYLIVRHYFDLAGEPKTWWHVPEAGHGQIPKVRPEEYEARIVTFFDEALLKSSDAGGP